MRLKMSYATWQPFCSGLRATTVFAPYCRRHFSGHIMGSAAKCPLYVSFPAVTWRNNDVIITSCVRWSAPGRNRCFFFTDVSVATIFLYRKHLNFDALLRNVPYSWWRHQMEVLSAVLAICAGNSPHKTQWRGALMFSLICAWINGWVNTRGAGDLRRNRAHYDVTVMSSALVHIDVTMTLLLCICDLH